MRPNFSRRVRALQNEISGNFLDAIITSDPNDVFYYTGYETQERSCFLIIDTVSSKPKLFVPPLENRAKNVKTAEVIFYHSIKEVSDSLNFYNRTGFDERNMNASVFIKLGRELKKAHDIIKIPRMVKDDYELSCIEKSIKITAKCLKEMKFYGKTEKTACFELQKIMLDNKVYPAFMPIIASGKNTAFVHYVPGDTKIKKDILLVDVGVRYGGYCSDVTRVYFSSKGYAKFYKDVMEMREYILDAIRPGISFKEINTLYEKLMKEKGYKIFHSFGHGLGLSVHEKPEGEDILQEGMILTVEPGVYVKNKGGCRIEDMVLVRKGKPRILTKSIQLELV